MKTPVYKDSKVSIYKNSLGKIFIDWTNKKEEIHINYMESKLGEFVGNNFSGSWPILANQSVEKGMRCFTIKRENNTLYVEWRT